ncbi:uncharacterized protein N7446_005283 [Penicillium canescens]|uniref:Major facilitator superfamily (MFS) profile domain-containing protein n=1 Tax=Penicillium canescens TaxID=5083 RepID=A0AAD6N7M8_PENCN|nr:uncharacterized protein N7446_005283 [Penicillium canescens]KAJ6038478.1 hypothetical protein N7460_008249 [Penicillium canescens]KAJ6068246.1 hypothetical protein N7446_005283 [Penicillium canescens]
MLGPICQPLTAKDFRISEEVMILATSLFMLGFAFGPIIFGPLSKLYGRKRPMFLGMFVFAIFHPRRSSPEPPGNLHMSLSGWGTCQCASCHCVSSSFGIPLRMLLLTSVVWGRCRSAALPFPSSPLAPFVGPVAGPITGSFITLFLAWRWTVYITATWAFAFSTIGFLTIPETFKVTLLSQHAKCQRTKTKNWAFHAKAEESVISTRDIEFRYLFRPFQMLFQEPILLLVTLYVGIIYGFLYICFVAYPISFQYDRGWQEGVAALAFVAIICGVAVACLIIVLFSLTRHRSTLSALDESIPRNG